MGRYRKKPVVVEAEQFDGGIETYLLIFEWMKACGDTHALANEVYYSTPEMRLHTLEGTMSARPGDWIIRGVKGEFYPCRADIFEATYEPLDAIVPGLSTPWHCQKHPSAAEALVHGQWICEDCHANRCVRACAGLPDPERDVARLRTAMEDTIDRLEVLLERQQRRCLSKDGMSFGISETIARARAAGRGGGAAMGLETRDMTGQPRSDAELEETMVIVRKHLVVSILNLPPDLGMSLASIHEFLGELKAYRAAIARARADKPAPPEKETHGTH